MKLSRDRLATLFGIFCIAFGATAIKAEKLPSPSPRIRAACECNGGEDYYNRLGNDGNPRNGQCFHHWCHSSDCEPANGKSGGVIATELASADKCPPSQPPDLKTNPLPKPSPGQSNPSPSPCSCANGDPKSDSTGMACVQDVCTGTAQCTPKNSLTAMPPVKTTTIQCPPCTSGVSADNCLLDLDTQIIVCPDDYGCIYPSGCSMGCCQPDYANPIAGPEYCFGVDPSSSPDPNE